MSDELDDFTANLNSGSGEVPTPLGAPQPKLTPEQAA